MNSSALASGSISSNVKLLKVLLYLSAFGAIITCWTWLVSPTPSVEGYLGLAILLVAMQALVSDTCTGKLGPLSLTFWAFIAVWSGFAPLYQFHIGRLPWADVPATDLYPWAQLLTLGAALAYRIGQVTASSDGSPELAHPRHPRIFIGSILLPILAFPLAAISGVSISSRFSSRDELIEAYAEQGIEYSSGGGAMLGLLKTLPICIAAVGLYLVVNEIVRRVRVGASVSGLLIWALIVSAMAAATFANPLSNSRFQALSAILMLVIVLVPFRKPLSRAFLVVGLLAGLLVVYPLSAAFKNTAAANRTSIGLDNFASVDFDGFQQTVNALWFVEQHGHTYGYHLISALGFFIPRSLWEGKALPASYPVAESRGYTFQNLSLPLWSELYVEFGVIGMIVLVFLIGRFSRRADDAFRAGAATTLALVTPVLAAVQIGVLRGPLGAQIVFAATCVFLVLILLGPPIPNQESDLATDVRFAKRQPT